MKTVAQKDIRKEIKKYIDHADERMVNIIYAMIGADSEVDWWDEISAEERAAINKGEQQLDAGKGIPHEEVVKKYSKWFVR